MFSIIGGENTHNRRWKDGIHDNWNLGGNRPVGRRGEANPGKKGGRGGSHGVGQKGSIGGGRNRRNKKEEERYQHTVNGLDTRKYALGKEGTGKRKEEERRWGVLEVSLQGMGCGRLLPVRQITMDWGVWKT
ncbi:hypothetical protein Tco_0896792 [Tanacetum coccineum]